MKIKTVIKAFFLVLMSVISLIPFYLMFSMSTFKSEMIFQGKPLLSHPEAWNGFAI